MVRYHSARLYSITQSTFNYNKYTVSASMFYDRHSMFRTLSTFLAIGSLLLLGISSPAADTQSDVDVRHTGDKVPNFKVRTLDGRKTTLRAIQSDENSNSSGVTVLTFWCSFCGSCRMVDQPLSDLSQKYKGKVAVMALDSSAGEEARTSDADAAPAPVGGARAAAGSDTRGAP